MIAFIWSMLVGKFGIGLVLAGACIAVWFLTPSVPGFSWLTDPMRKKFLILGLVIGGVTAGYGRGYIEGDAWRKSKIEKEIKNAVATGTAARERATRDLDAGRVPDNWFRDD